MADVVIRGVTYSGVDTVSIPADGGGTETFMQPSGSISITENGVVDVTNYASAAVNVSGGGGAPSASDAILLVTVPANSVVTMTKGQDSRVPTMWLIANNNTNAIALFVVESADFDQTAWTVTAESGAETASTTVVIDSNKQYGLKLLETIWLVKNGVGNINTDFFGQTMNVTQESGFVLMKNTGNNVGFIRSLQAIDLTDKTEIVLQLALDSNNRYGQSWYSSSGNVPVLGVALANVPPAVSGTSSVTNISTKTWLRTSTGADTTQSEFTLDVSALSGLYIVCVTVGASASLSGTYGYWNIYNLYVH